MPRYKAMLTKHETTISTAEIEIDLPTDDVAQVRAFMELTASDEMRYRSGGVRPLWENGEPMTKISATAIRLAGDTDPDFAEVEPPPSPAPVREPAPSSDDDIAF